MALKLFHAFVNPVADQAGFTGTKPSDWNAPIELSNAGLGAPSGNDAFIRETLTAPRTYYVRTDGNDSNTGLVNNSGGAFLTIQKAYDTVCGLDTNNQPVTIQLADGTYTSGLNATSSWAGGGVVTIVGNTGTPTNVVVNVTGSGFIINCTLTAFLAINSLKIISTVMGIYHTGSGIVKFAGIDFGAITQFQIYAVGPTAYIVATDNYTISGAAQYHMVAQYGSIQVAGLTITVNGTLTYNNAFVLATRGGKIGADSTTYTITGSVTCQRYQIDSGGLIYTAGGGANYFPGNSAGSGGTTTGGGFYI